MIGAIVVTWSIVGVAGLALSSVVFGLVWSDSYDGDPDREVYKRNYAWAVMGSLLMPLALVMLIAWAARTTLGSVTGSSDDGPVRLSRRQRKSLAYEKERLALEKSALETQREYMRLVQQSGYEVER